MPRRSLSVTVSMPIEMDERIEEEAQKNGMTYSEYVRTVLQNANESPFEPADVDLRATDDDAAEAQMGGA